jgi:UDP-N-acetylmuramate dehydrogenase
VHASAKIGDYPESTSALHLPTLSFQANLPLVTLNTFGIVAKAAQLVAITSVADAQALVAQAQPGFHILGGGSNLVLTGDVKTLVAKVEILGKQVLAQTDTAVLLEAGAGENWHDFVAWTVQQGHAGLENLALIPGTVGAAPVQNIGAYGIELKDRFESLDYVDLQTGALKTLRAADCHFAYRDSVFKDPSSTGLAGRALITHVRFKLRKPWVREIGYADLQKKSVALDVPKPSAQDIFDWVCTIRQSKLPDWRVMGNAGSFFKNPTVTAEQCKDIIAREPKLVHYALGYGQFKLAAAWLIEACGWRGKHVGNAAVHDKHALVIVNRGGCTGGEVMTLCKAIQTSVYERFGILLQPEPVVW